MKHLAPKTVLQSRYRIEKLIGKGGMGEVYLASDTRLGHSVALKRTTVGDDPIFYDAFEREARTLAQLRHPVLPKVSDHFVENNEQFLIMEYIDGEDLAKRLKTQTSPFPLNWVMFWADQLLGALEYLHKHNPPIIHRDIKPQNLKLTTDNQIILLDFGLSKRSVGETRITSSGSVVGYTPHYAPMEQIRGTGTNATSDLYALSATLYHLLSGTVPPDALRRADNLIAGGADPLEPLMIYNPEISKNISDIIIRGMNLSQENRYQNAREMQKDLRIAFNDLQKNKSSESFSVEADKPSITEDKTVAFSSETFPQDVSGNDLAESDYLNTEIDVNRSDMSGEKTEVFNVSDVDPHRDSSSSAEVASPPPVADETLMFSEVDASSADSFTSSSPNESLDNSQLTNYSAEETSASFGDVDASDSTSSAQFDTYGGGGLPPLPVEDSANEFESNSEAVEDVSDFDSDNSQPAEHDSKDSKPTVAPKSEKQASGKKYAAILGGLGLLLLVVVGVVGGGVWYASSNNLFGGEPTPTITPPPTPMPTPTETPLETTLPDENLNANSNENADVDVNGTSVVETPNPEVPAGEVKSTPANSSKNTGTVTPTPFKKTTPKPVKTSTPKPVVRTPTPRPQPTKAKGGKEPVILQ
ncbi:MAG: protein kinase domain-containing protein [Pyrinomonadaceae bacterium]